jgi:hypothetical protein
MASVIPLGRSLSDGATSVNSYQTAVAELKKKGVDRLPTARYLERVFQIATIYGESSSSYSLLLNVFHDMILPRFNTYNVSMDIYGEMIIRTTLWKCCTKNNKIFDEIEIKNTIADLKHRFETYEYLRDNYHILPEEKKREYNFLREDLIPLIGLNFIEQVLYPEGRNQ